MPDTTQTTIVKTVPVTDPSHPSHKSFLEILLTSLRLASQIGPAVVTIVDPGDAKLAGQLGGIAGQALNEVSVS